MTNTTRNREFGIEVLSQWPLDAALEWIKKTLGPEEVFDHAELISWARDNCSPADVFSDKELAEWAEGHGYIKE